jgi:hypothetical protein
VTSQLLAQSRIPGHFCLADVPILMGTQTANRQPLECTRSHPFSQGWQSLLCFNNFFIYSYLWNALGSLVEKKKDAQRSAFFTGKVVFLALQMRMGMMM